MTRMLLPLVVCCSSASTTAPRATTLHEQGVRASIELAQPVIARIEDLRVTVTLENLGDAAVRLQTQYLDAPSLVLEVTDAGHRPVAAGPPPTPVADDTAAWTTLPPHKPLRRTYTSPILVPVAAGQYFVRFKGVPADPVNAQVQSTWASFEVKPAG